jgi:Amt family ammonium transporter
MSDPAWLDTGANGWQLTASTLVGLLSIPGLAAFYAGTIQRKWSINSGLMVLYAYAAVLICWVLWAYKMAFGSQWGRAPFIGTPGPAVTMDYELSQATLPASNVIAAFPMATMVYFQFVFAAVTVIIIAGAFLGRMNFAAWILFVPLWLTFSYTVGAFSIWNGGFLWNLGVIDYSGGFVVHLSSGTSGYVGAWWIGPRLLEDRKHSKPSNLLMVMIGAGLIWICWNGSNGAAAYSPGVDAGVALLNTNLSAAMSLLAWATIDLIFHKKVGISGAVDGMIAGLVAITPAAGVVSGWGSVIIGVCAGTIPWISMFILERIPVCRIVDDPMAVLHMHAIPGLMGGLLVGIFATKSGCMAYGLSNNGGAIEGNAKQMWFQLVGALFIVALNAFMTSVVLLFIKYVCRVPLRMTKEQMVVGDYAIHGESAYSLRFDPEQAVPDEDINLNHATCASNELNGAVGPSNGS